jgi:hypothetical protein
MSSVEVYVVVEGTTEQTFVRDVLAPQMAHKGMYLNAALIGKPGHKGGNIRCGRAKNDIGHFLKQRADTYVSTMFDYFRIDRKWPKVAEVRRRIRDGARLTAVEKAETIEMATYNDIVDAFSRCDARNRFIPYIQIHEFEALLFGDPDILAENIGIDASLVRGILTECGKPEEIDEDPTGVPSKRLQRLKDRYRKVADGRTISQAIGIPTMRRQCDHFNDWLGRLERLCR